MLPSKNGLRIKNAAGSRVFKAPRAPSMEQSTGIQLMRLWAPGNAVFPHQERRPRPGSSRNLLRKGSWED